jgi:hypothetical protein
MSSIERFWRDVFYGVLGFYRDVFFTLEDNGILDIENARHLAILHRIDIARLNRHLSEFMEGWNRHPLSSESGLTPEQLFLMHLPPTTADLAYSNVEVLF